MVPKAFNPKIKSFLTALVLMAAAVFAMPGIVQAKMDDYPRVRLRSLDKVTAETMTFEADVGSTVKFGSLYIKVQACRKAPPIEPPESSAFLQIWEITPEDKAEWVFSGWMFASSPALSSMDHPIYDVWVLDCLGDAVSDDMAVSEDKDAASDVKDATDDTKTGNEEAASQEKASMKEETRIPEPDKRLQSPGSDITAEPLQDE